ncbi:hypothetical protein MXB_5090 [Myxobolus squamalis]|nr:hypothetical protein MXB_5090 [Myxobolus squamalis]
MRNQIKSSQKSFSLIAQSQEDKRLWMKNLKEYATYARGRHNHSEKSEAAAVWLPDKQSNTCMRCHTYHFSALKRKHHCRKCGLLVCGPCSTHTWIIDTISDNALRVCDFCYFVFLQESDKSNAKAVNRSIQPTEEFYSEEEGDEINDEAGGGMIFFNIKDDDKMVFYNEV